MASFLLPLVINGSNQLKGEFGPSVHSSLSDWIKYLKGPQTTTLPWEPLFFQDSGRQEPGVS